MRESRTRYVLLGLLLDGPQTGYELKRRIEEQIAYFWNESLGQIYPELHRLVEAGWAVSRGGARPGKRTRIVYSITAAGRSAFREWVSQPAEPQPVRNELLLKLFFGWELELSAAEGQLARFEQSLERLAARYDEIRQSIATDELSDDKRLAWELSLDLGQRLLEARRAWCQASRRRLAERQAGAKAKPKSGRRRGEA